MKVTYRQNRFEIDGVPVINPEVIAYQKDGCWYEAYYRNGAHWAVFEGNEFDLPDNIECEIVEVRCVKPCDEYRKKCSPDGCKFPKKVYRLKLKEPLVHSISCAAHGMHKKGHILGECNCKELSLTNKAHLVNDCPDCETKVSLKEPLVDTGSKETQEELTYESLMREWGSDTDGSEPLSWVLQHFHLTRK